MRDVWLQRTLALLAGGGLASLLPEDLRLWVLAVLVLLGVRLWFWRPQDFFGRLERSGLILLGALFLAGYLYGLAGEWALPEPLTLESVEVRGVLEDWNGLSDEGSGVIQLEEVRQAQAKGIKAGERFRLVVYPDKEGKLPGLWEKVQPGDTLYFRARLERPKPAGTKGGFDSRIYYAARGLEGILTARGEPLGIYPGKPPLNWQVRAQVDTALEEFASQTAGDKPAVGIGAPVGNSGTGERTEISEQTGVLKGILFGDATGIPQEVIERYKITGVLHVFAASGSNVAFVIALVWGLLRFLPASVRVAGSSLAVVFYALLCGGSLPIVRASIMGIAVLLGRLGRGKVATLRWLMLAALGMFLSNPVVLQDLGFQLSFTAAWGIVSVAPRLASQPWLAKLPVSLRGVLAATLAAQITTFPVLVSSFHRVSLVGLVANVFVLFLLGSVLEVGLLGVILSFAPALAAPFFQVSLWLLQAADKVLGWLARLPWADFWVLQPGLLFWFVWYGAIIVWILGWERMGFVAQVFLRRGVWKLRELRSAFATVPRVPAVKHPGAVETEDTQKMQAARESEDKPRAAGDRGNQEAQETGRAQDVQKTQESRKAHRTQESMGALNAWKDQRSWVVRTTLRSLAFQGRWAPFGVTLLLLLLLWSPWDGGELKVSFIDVGQGDSLLIQTPRGQALLIDAGPKSERFDAGERIVLPYLLENRIRHLEALLVTHEHEDHIGGARAILDNMPVDWVGVPASGERLQSSEWRAGLPTKIWSYPGKIKLLEAGDRIELDSGAWLEVVGPQVSLEGTHSDPNNNSLVLMLHYLDETVFLTADMEAEEMRTLWGEKEETVDFYKEPHHGSRFSLDKELLDMMQPQAVFISVGRNTFGHPSPEVLNYWAERGIPVYRTDEGGTLTLRIGKRGALIETGRKLE